MTSSKIAINFNLALVGNAVCTYIPKNACTTLNVSAAIHNGVIREPKDFNWGLHGHGLTATDSELQNRKYTFAFMRCPYKRLASAYLDKVIRGGVVSNNFIKASKSNEHITTISFSQFVKGLTTKEVLEADMHWATQTSYLILDKYDDIFSVEQMEQAANILRSKINFIVYDTRPYAKHGVDFLNPIGAKGEHALLDGASIMKLKSEGNYPSYESLYTEELIAIVSEVYMQDIEMYKSIFGITNLMYK